MSFAYFNEFQATVSVLLGGMEMAEEFFLYHPDLAEALRIHAAFHEGKGGAAWKGANIFFARELRSVLRADRAIATRTRIGSVEDVLENGRN
jgi:hypothetical protein